MKKMKLNIQLFANGAIEFPINKGLQGKIEWSSTSNGIEANSSTVTATLYARVTSNSAWGPDWNVTINIAGNTKNQSSWSPSPVVNTSWKSMLSHTYTVQHDDTGHANCWIGGSIQGPSGTTVANSFSEGGSYVTLDYIPRATQCPKINGYIENSVTVNLNPSSNTFTHTLEYEYPTGTRHTLGAGKSQITFTLGTEYYSYISGNNNFVDLPIFLKTYQNNTLVGSETSNTMTAMIDDNLNYPVITEFTMVDTNQETINLTGNSTKFISGYSKLDVSVTANYKNGALPSYLSLYQEPKGANGQWGNLGTFYASNGLIIDGNKTTIKGIVPTYDSQRIYIAIVTDNRYNGSDENKVISSIEDLTESSLYYPNILDYFPIYLVPDSQLENSGISFNRPQIFSDQIYVTFIGEFWNSDFGESINSLTIKWRVRENNGIWSNEQTLVKDTDYFFILTSGNKTTFCTNSSGSLSGTGSGIELTNPLSEDGKWNYLSNYQIEITFTDKLSKQVITRNIHSTVPIYDWWQTEEGEKYFEINGHLMVNEKEILPSQERKIFTFTSNTYQFSLSNNMNDYPIDAIKGVGLGISTSNGNIVIGKGISIIKISANIFIERLNTAAYLWAFIKHNNSTSNMPSSIISGSTHYGTANITECVLFVSEGDTIGLRIDNPSYATAAPVVRGSWSNTYITLEVIQ